jgi:hypothetical protein
MSAGARLTVMRFGGSDRPSELSAARHMSPGLPNRLFPVFRAFH